MRRLFRGPVLALALSASAIVPSLAEAQYPIRINVAPPPPQVEVVPVAPSPRHAWIPGHWQWRAGFRRHVWVPGHFVVRPAINRVWVPAQWVNERGYWVFRPGRWVVGPAAPVMVQPVPRPVYAQPQPVYAQPQPGYDPGFPQDQPVDVDVAPPPPQVEVVPVAPSASHVWLPGHWNWHPMHRRHVWVPGHYAIRQHGAVWQPAQWVRFGPRWRYVPGHWRRY